MLRFRDPNEKEYDQETMAPRFGWLGNYFFLQGGAHVINYALYRYQKSWQRPLEECSYNCVTPTTFSNICAAAYLYFMPLAPNVGLRLVLATFGSTMTAFKFQQIADAVERERVMKEMEKFPDKQFKPEFFLDFPFSMKTIWVEDVLAQEAKKYSTNGRAAEKREY